MANRIRFSENWDKLARPRFTTIRSYSKEKEEYYRCHIGQPFTILRVKNIWSYIGRKIGTATLLRVRVVVPAQMSAAELQADVLRAGKPDQAWLDRLLKMDRALCLDFENHTGILAGAA